MSASSSPFPTQTRPTGGTRLLRIDWGEALLLHWRADIQQLRALLPEGIEPDIWHGSAWLGVIALRMQRASPAMVSSIPMFTPFLQLNVRTYVRFSGDAGVFSFSRDASSPIAVWLGRNLFRLPYFRARIRVAQRTETKRFTSHRTHQGAAPAEFECVWAPTRPVPPSKPGELLEFISKRQYVFAAQDNRVYSFRVWQEPWAVREARVGRLSSTLWDAAGLSVPTGDPIAHHVDKVATEVWPVRKIDTSLEAAALLDPALSPPPATFSR